MNSMRFIKELRQELKTTQRVQSDKRSRLKVRNRSDIELNPKSQKKKLLGEKKRLAKGLKSLVLRSAENNSKNIANPKELMIISIKEKHK